MKLLDVKNALAKMTEVTFQLPDKTFVPAHFHVTELGEITKHFIDCGGVVRTEKVANFQLWEADDFEHRLTTNKLYKIIEMSENILGLGNLEVEVEFQSGTIGKYKLDFDGKQFQLLNTQTNCLASDSCGIPPEKQKKNLGDMVITSNSNNCKPGSGCC
jgi:hypothetical protein